MVFSARILYDKDRSVQSILYAALHCSSNPLKRRIIL